MAKKKKKIITDAEVFVEEEAVEVVEEEVVTVEEVKPIVTKKKCDGKVKVMITKNHLSLNGGTHNIWDKLDLCKDKAAKGVKSKWCVIL